MFKKPVSKALAVALGLSLSGAVFAAEGGDGEWNAGITDKSSEEYKALHAEPDLENGREVFEVCSACHMPEGWGTKDGTFPQLAGQHRQVLIKQLSDIRQKNRDNPTMYPFAVPREIGGAQSVADVTTYISELPMNPDNGKGPWGKDSPFFSMGKTLYEDNCVRCHGDHGEGSNEEFFPKIQGQHYKYMLRQFEWIRDGKRRNANPDMVEQIKNFSDQDMKMVINYVSRIDVPEEDLAPSADWINPDFD